MEASGMSDEVLKQGRVLSINISDKNQLSTAYMPFVKGGGFFISTDKEYHLGDEVFLVLKLFDDPDKFTLPCKVVLIAPKGAQGVTSAGIGVQFLTEEAKNVRGKIETYLAGRA